MKYDYPIMSITENLPNSLLGKDSSYSNCGHPALIVAVDDVKREKIILPLCSHMFLSPSLVGKLMPIVEENRKVTYCTLDKLIICSDSVFDMVIPSKNDKRRPITKQTYNDIMINTIMRNAIMSEDETFSSVIDTVAESPSVDIEDGEKLPSMPDILKGFKIKDRTNFTDVLAKFDEILLDYLSFDHIMYEGLDYGKINNLLKTFDYKTINSTNLNDEEKSTLSQLIKNRIKGLLSLSTQMAVTHILDTERKIKTEEKVSISDNNKYESYMQDDDIKARVSIQRKEYFAKYVLTQDEELGKLEELSSSSNEMKNKYLSFRERYLIKRRSIMMSFGIGEKDLVDIKAKIKIEEQELNR